MIGSPGIIAVKNRGIFTFEQCEEVPLPVATSESETFRYFDTDYLILGLLNRSAKFNGVPMKSLRAINTQSALFCNCRNEASFWSIIRMITLEQLKTISPPRMLMLMFGHHSK